MSNNDIADDARPLGKGEVVSSILTGSTTAKRNPRARSRAGRPHGGDLEASLDTHRGISADIVDHQAGRRRGGDWEWRALGRGDL